MPKCSGIVLTQNYEWAPLKLTVDDAVKDLDRLQYFLTGERWDSLWSQRRYAIDVLKKINMEKCKAISTPMVQQKIIHKPGNSTVRTVQVKQHCWWLRALDQWKGKDRIISDKRGEPWGRKRRPEKFDWQVTNDDNHFLIRWHLDGE